MNSVPLPLSEHEDVLHAQGAARNGNRAGSGCHRPERAGIPDNEPSVEGEKSRTVVSHIQPAGAPGTTVHRGGSMSGITVANVANLGNGDNTVVQRQASRTDPPT